MHIVEHCRQSLRERGVPFNEKTPFGVMLSVPSACLTAEEFVAHGCDFLVIGTNDLTQYTHAADRELASAERYYRPASPAMKKLITMVMETAKAGSVPVTICGLAVGNPVNTVQYLQMGLRSFSVSPQNLLHTKKLCWKPTPTRTTPNWNKAIKERGCCTLCSSPFVWGTCRAACGTARQEEMAFIKMVPSVHAAL